MKRITVASVLVLTLLVLPFPQKTNAGSGVSNTVLKDVHSFKALYGSTDIDSRYALLNYIDVEVSVPGLRVSDDIWVSSYVIPDTNFMSFTSRMPDQYKYFGWGLSSKTVRWRYYTPPSPSQRIRLRRGFNKIPVTFTYQYFGGLAGSSQGMRGQATVNLVVR
jgi:hypothetical protein